jgi:hypothetical protein
MLRRALPRFTLRTAFAVVSIASIGLTIVYQVHEIGKAERRYETARDLWVWDKLSGRIATIVDASRELVETESDAIWISREAAIRRHLKRLTDTSAKVEEWSSSVTNTLSDDYYQKELRPLRNEIDSLSKNSNR